MHKHNDIQYLGITCAHLGNVRAVVGDRKLWNSSFAGEFRANVLSVSNYYPFGMAQTGRNWDGIGKSLDYGARWYDPRKARWDAVDAFEAKYPSVSPYLYVMCNPVNIAYRRFAKWEVSSIQVPNLLSVDKQDVGVLKNVYYPIQNSNGSQNDTKIQENSEQQSNP
ncbi:MAG TPA: hypothetical protein PLW09_14410 [Candidatus Kapabacteria bacterium]|nr:hypothetical protein [Candidatus Kapabacteria bacterium]